MSGYEALERTVRLIKVMTVCGSFACVATFAASLFTQIDGDWNRWLGYLVMLLGGWTVFGGVLMVLILWMLERDFRADTARTGEGDAS